VNVIKSSLMSRYFSETIYTFRENLFIYALNFSNGWMVASVYRRLT